VNRSKNSANAVSVRGFSPERIAPSPLRRSIFWPFENSQRR
jgi:hypothetical protein